MPEELKGRTPEIESKRAKWVIMKEFESSALFFTLAYLLLSEKFSGENSKYLGFNQLSTLLSRMISVMEYSSRHKEQFSLIPDITKTVELLVSIFKTPTIASWNLTQRSSIENSMKSLDTLIRKANEEQCEVEKNLLSGVENEDSKSIVPVEQEINNAITLALPELSLSKKKDFSKSSEVVIIENLKKTVGKRSVEEISQMMHSIITMYDDKTREWCEESGNPVIYKDGNILPCPSGYMCLTLEERRRVHDYRKSYSTLGKK